MAEKPLLFVIAGSNGSGKTTFVEKINPDILLKTKFVNADIIAKNLKEKFPDKKEGHLNLMAGKEALKLYEKYISEKRSFSMETTLSGNSPIQFLKRAKEIGFETSLVYIGIESPSDSKIRIEKRVSQGGHNIPDEDIIRRYGRSMKNFSKALEYADKTKVYDNTFKQHQLLFELEGKVVKSIENVDLPNWVQFIIETSSLKLGQNLSFIDN
jgi:predicted ABC-type ATPase